ncbi:nitroreductase family protein [Gallicola sp. Sow4_E12]|uniref:nitroreductase family protein n=1 Tax=Gallicola sp. Sow4_E12 TaxID=3438785 RepID=UPI003F925070
MDYLAAVAKRRSVYSLKKESTLKDENLIEMIKQVTQDAPSSLNSQSQRVVILLGEEHDYLWENIVMETLRKVVNDEERFKETEKKIKGFAKAYGTVLFYQDKNSLKIMEEKFPDYAHNFDRWASEGDGILLYGIWTALASCGLGASVQHYNPLIDEEVAQRYDIPKEWMLISQMPFGVIEEYPEPKEKMAVEEKVKVFGEK